MNNLQKTKQEIMEEFKLLPGVFYAENHRDELIGFLESSLNRMVQVFKESLPEEKEFTVELMEVRQDFSTVLKVLK